MVLVEMITGPPPERARNAAGTRYASDFPTPVPASTMRFLPS